MPGCDKVAGEIVICFIVTVATARTPESGLRTVLWCVFALVTSHLPAVSAR